MVEMETNLLLQNIPGLFDDVNVKGSFRASSPAKNCEPVP